MRALRPGPQSRGPFLTQPPVNLGPAPNQFFGDEAELWFDGNQDADLVVIPGGYPQLDVEPQIEDAWDHFVTDEDDYVGADDQQLGADSVIAPQYFGEDAETADEEIQDDWQFILDDDDDANPDGLAPYYGEDAELLAQDDDEQVIVDSQPQLTGDAPIEDGWDWWRQEEDDYVVLDDFQLFIVPLAIEDAWDWSLDETVVEATPTGYHQLDVQPQIEDPWDWFVTDEDEYAVSDDQQPVAAVAPPQYYGEDAELADQEDDEQAILPNDPIDSVATYYGETAELLDQEDDDQAVVDSQPTLPGDAPIEDGWDWQSQEDDDQAIVDDSAPRSDSQLQYFGEDAELTDQDSDDQALDDTNIGVDFNLNLNVEDAWDWFVTDDDDYVVIDDYALLDVQTFQLQYFGEDAELAELDSDDAEWQSRDTDVLGATLAQTFDDPWEHFGADDDDFVVQDDYASSVGSAVPEDGWDWSDQGDEDALAPEDRSVADVVPLTVEDAWDHFVAEDEETVPADETQGTSPPPSLALCAEDAWDHFPAEDDEYFLDCDYPLLNIGSVGLLSGVAVCGGLAFGICVGALPFKLQQFDPRFFNGSNAWLGYRTSSGGGVW